MSRRPLGMRVQLAAAMVALAVLSVAVAGLLIHRAADREVADFGRRDLQQTANRLAIEASIRYEETGAWTKPCLLYTSPSPRDGLLSRMPSSA